MKMGAKLWTRSQGEKIQEYCNESTASYRKSYPTVPSIAPVSLKTLGKKGYARLQACDVGWHSLLASWNH